MSTIPLEWVQRAPAIFLVPAHPTTSYPQPLVKQGPSLWGTNLSTAQFSLTQRRYNKAQAWCWKVFQMLVWFLIIGLDRSSSWPLKFWLAQPPFLGRGQHGLWSHKWVALELEEGGIWRKGTCKSEILFGENTVHALRQSSGVWSRARHSGAQNEFPASRRWEVWHRVLPSLFWRAHSLQFLLRWSHGCSLEQNQMLNSRASPMLNLDHVEGQMNKHDKYIKKCSTLLSNAVSHVMITQKPTRKKQEAWNTALTARDYK